MNGNYLHLHPSKTKHFSIFENNVTLYQDVLPIDKVSTIKDLGIYFSKKLSWSNHINNKLANCNRSLLSSITYVLVPPLKLSSTSTWPV